MELSSILSAGAAGKGKPGLESLPGSSEADAGQGTARDETDFADAFTKLSKGDSGAQDTGEEQAVATTSENAPKSTDLRHRDVTTQPANDNASPEFTEDDRSAETPGHLPLDEEAPRTQVTPEPGRVPAEAALGHREIAHDNNGSVPKTGTDIADPRIADERLAGSRNDPGRPANVSDGGGPMAATAGKMPGKPADLVSGPASGDSAENVATPADLPGAKQKGQPTPEQMVSARTQSGEAVARSAAVPVAAQLTAAAAGIEAKTSRQPGQLAVEGGVQLSDGTQQTPVAKPERTQSEVEPAQVRLAGASEESLSRPGAGQADKRPDRSDGVAIADRDLAEPPPRDAARSRDGHRSEGVHANSDQIGRAAEAQFSAVKSGSGQSAVTGLPGAVTVDPKIVQTAAAGDAGDQLLQLQEVGLSESGRLHQAERAASAAAQHVPRPVAQQIAEAMVTLRDGAVELQLSPEELGRVRLTMSQSEAGMVVQVSADRQDTLDLLRRNIGLLNEEFAATGLGTASFSFEGAESGESFGDAAGDAERNADESETLEAAADGTTVAARQIASGRLDIRI